MFGLKKNLRQNKLNECTRQYKSCYHNAAASFKSCRRLLNVSKNVVRIWQNTFIKFGIDIFEIKLVSKRLLKFAKCLSLERYRRGPESAEVCIPYRLVDFENSAR